MRIIATIEGCPITEQDDDSVTYTAKMAIDNDGSNNRQHDPDWQAGTSLQHGGKPIDSEAVPGVVVPPAIIQGVKGVVLGCAVQVSYNDKISPAVVFDIGPHAKLGEGTPELARRLGINPSSLRGGVDAHIVNYTLFPGTAAFVDGVEYALQAS